MASVSIGRTAPLAFGDTLLASVEREGSASHPFLAQVRSGRDSDAARNLADAVHFLAALHGRQPGVVELAGHRTVETGARAWLVRAGEAIAYERTYLGRLSVAVGPIPGTPGGANAEAVVQTQRHALATLAQSERRGCALGAALAFAIDWIALRTVLDAAATRFEVETGPSMLGEHDDLAAVAHAVASELPGIERALTFGAEQIALQHRGLWDLLEARASARAGA